MHSFANASSTHYKRDNWEQVVKFCAKQVSGQRAAVAELPCLHAIRTAELLLAASCIRLLLPAPSGCRQSPCP